MVVASRDKKSPDPEANLVAIKKIEKAFEHKVFTKRTLRELKILRLLKHENVRKIFGLGYMGNFKIIGISTLLLPKSREDFDDM